MMKKIVFLIFIMGLMMSQTALASEGNNETLKKVIRKSLNYPKFAKQEKLHGFVLVEFEVEASGNILIKEMNASNDELAQHVIGVLNDVHLNDNRSVGTHFMKFNFKYIDI